MEKTIKAITVNEESKKVIKDLTVLTGLTDKINSDYFKNFRNLILFYINESSQSSNDDILSNKEVKFYIPEIGEIKIQPKTLTLSDNTTFNYTFTPSVTFNRKVKDAYNNKVELISDFANKYSEKVIALYDKFLGE